MYTLGPLVCVETVVVGCVAAATKWASWCLANSIVPLPPAARIEAEAAAWIARLDSDEANNNDRLAFQAWREQSSLHQRAAEQLSNLWSDMNCLSSSGTVTPHVLLPSGHTRPRTPIRS